MHVLIRYLTIALIVSFLKFSADAAVWPKTGHRFTPNVGRAPLQHHHINLRLKITADHLEKIQYKWAVAYSFNTPLYGEESEIIDNQSLNPSARLPGSILTPGQASQLLSVLENHKSYGGALYACFEPRMGIVFFDKDSIVAGYVSICFACNRLNSHPAIRVLQKVMAKRKYDYGFSDKGRSELQAICKELHLQECGK